MREACEAAAFSDLCDFHMAVDQELLGVTNSGHLNVGRKGKAGYILKLMREIVWANEKLSREEIKRQFISIMTMNIGSDGIHLVNNGIGSLWLGVDVVRSVLINAS